MTAAEWGWESEHAPIVEIGELVYELVAQMDRYFVAVARDVGLTGPQAQAIIQLNEPVPMAALATSLGCDASNLTGIVDRLSARGLVERRVDGADRRVKRVVLTADGKRLRSRLERLLFRRPSGFATLTASEQASLRALLRKAADRPPPG